MKVFVDSENRIHDVGSTKDESLTELTINDEANPFEGWSIAKICCYKVWVSAGNIMGFTPYVPSSLIEHIDQLGQENTIQDGSIMENATGIYDVAEVADENTVSIEEMAEMIDNAITRIEALEEREA